MKHIILKQIQSTLITKSELKKMANKLDSQKENIIS